MSTRPREFAKFFAGLAASETLGHWWIGMFGRDMLPMNFKWFTFTPEVNLFAMALWPIALIVLVYIGWLRRPREAGAVPSRAMPGA